MGTHELLQHQALALEAGEKVPMPQGIMAGLDDSATANMKIDGAYGAALWAQKWGGPVDVSRALARAMELVAVQTSVGGFMLAEQMASDPHSNFHLYGWCGLRGVAKAFGPQGRQLLQQTGVLFRHFKKLFQPLVGVNHRDQIDLLCAPGMRCEQEGPPAFQVFGMAWRLMYKLQSPRWWDDGKLADPKFHGVRLLKQLLDAGDDLGGEPLPSDRPRLLCPINIYRSGSRVVAWLDAPEAARGNLGKVIPDTHQVRVGPFVEPCDWIDRDVDTGAITFGKYWAKPVPAIPPGRAPIRLGA